MSFEQNEVITKDKLDQLQSNYQWILENTPRARFISTGGTPRENKVVLLCGRVRFPRNKKKDTAGARVRFGKAFDPRCRPHVTTSVVSVGQIKVFCVINGPGGKAYPDGTGFDVFLDIEAASKKNNHFQRETYVHWQATGWRT